MAAVENKTFTVRRQPSRLQMRAPASIQINPVTEWNVAIPLLSPLVQSPNSNPTDEIKPCLNTDKQSAPEKPVAVVMKKWQHPASPFCYEPTPFCHEPTPFLPFVCTGSFDR